MCNRRLPIPRDWEYLRHLLLNRWDDFLLTVRK
jgi:hypothetical protein